MDGQHLFSDAHEESGDLHFLFEFAWRIQEAIMWLHVAVEKATKFDMGPPTEQATETLDNLVVLQEALVDLNSAIFTGKSVSAPSPMCQRPWTN